MSVFILAGAVFMQAAVVDDQQRAAAAASMLRQDQQDAGKLAACAVKLATSLAVSSQEAAGTIAEVAAYRCAKSEAIPPSATWREKARLEALDAVFIQRAK